MEIAIFISVLFSFSAVFYFVVQIGLTLGIRCVKQYKIEDKPFVSVIVAARNEERNIGQLLQRLLQQTYKNYEIIIVNDRSTDNTGKIIKDYQRSDSTITCVDVNLISDDMPAKKNALRAGIKASKGEILCFTDADCFPPPTWIENMIQFFEPEVGLVTGYSPYRIQTDNISHFSFFKELFFKFIAYEEFRAGIWSAGSIGWNLAWLCTGRNLAYRRKVYDEVNGFEKIKMSISGDDDLFLQLVRRQTNWQISYIFSKESFVPTEPPPSFRSFIEQRKRHFSAAKYFTYPMKLFFATYHSSNLLLFVSPLLYFFNGLPLLTVVICVLTKLLGDAILIGSSARLFDTFNFKRLFIFMEALYIFYNIIIGSLGLFRKFEWKRI